MACWGVGGCQAGGRSCCYDLPQMLEFRALGLGASWGLSVQGFAPSPTLILAVLHRDFFVPPIILPIEDC